MSQGGDPVVQQLDQQRAHTRREITQFQADGVITKEQAAKMIEAEAPVVESKFRLLPGVDWVLATWSSFGPTVAEFGGMSPAVVDLSAVAAPARDLWMRRHRVRGEDRDLLERFFRVLDRESYAIKREQLAEALSG